MSAQDETAIVQALRSAEAAADRAIKELQDIRALAGIQDSKTSGATVTLDFGDAFPPPRNAPKERDHWLRVRGLTIQADAEHPKSSAHS